MDVPGFVDAALDALVVVNELAVETPGDVVVELELAVDEPLLTSIPATMPLSPPMNVNGRCLK